MADKNYSKEDIMAFERKDKLSARMSAVKAVSILFEGKELPTEEFLVQSDKVYSWITQDQKWGKIYDGHSDNPDIPSSPDIPVPTKQQLKWLNGLQNKYGISPAEVYEKYGSYPNNKEQAIEIVRKIMVEANVKKDKSS